jgi:hypothetical protein
MMRLRRRLSSYFCPEQTLWFSHQKKSVEGTQNRFFLGPEVILHSEPPVSTFSPSQKNSRPEKPITVTFNGNGEIPPANEFFYRYNNCKWLCDGVANKVP